MWKENSYIPGTFMCLSFQFQKHLSLGRGGMILLDDKEAYNKLSKMVYHKNMEAIPENIPEIFSNAVFVPNMITKETDYIREILKSLKETTREKQLLLANLKGNIPERVYETDPLTKLFRYFI